MRITMLRVPKEISASIGPAFPSGDDIAVNARLFLEAFSGSGFIKAVAGATLVLALMLGAVARPAAAQEQDAVRQASQRFSAAMSAEDAGAAIAMVADDAVIVPPGRPPLKGKPEIQRFLNNMMRGVQGLTYASEDISPLGEGAAREIGGLSFKTRGGANGKAPQDITGKYMIVWQKVGGDWKVAADMWNRTANGGGQGGKAMGAPAQGKPQTEDAQ